MSFTSRLRHMIIIQEAILENDGLGNQIEQWQDFMKVRAEVQALSERAIGEMFASMQLMDISLYRFRIRFIKKLKTNIRIIYDNRYFQVKRVINQNELNAISIIIAQESL